MRAWDVPRALPAAAKNLYDGACRTFLLPQILAKLPPCERPLGPGTPLQPPEAHMYRLVLFDLQAVTGGVELVVRGHLLPARTMRITLALYLLLSHLL
jgi:hypothetical protein